MMSDRALAPSSKPAIEQWAAAEVYLGDEQALQVQHFYRAMDFLIEHAEKIQEEVFWSMANMLDLMVDFIFFDTTNSYFKTKSQKTLKSKRTARARTSAMTCRWSPSAWL